MGMFDELYCEYPLPDKEVQDFWFQTKSLSCKLKRYKIDKDGQLYIDDRNDWDLDEPRLNNDWVPLNTTEMIKFYTSINRVDKYEWYEYKVIINKGKVFSLEKINVS